MINPFSPFPSTHTTRRRFPLLLVGGPSPSRWCFASERRGLARIKISRGRTFQPRQDSSQQGGRSFVLRHIGLDFDKQRWIHGDRPTSCNSPLSDLHYETRYWYLTNICPLLHPACRTAGQTAPRNRHDQAKFIEYALTSPDLSNSPISVSHRILTMAIYLPVLMFMFMKIPQQPPLNSEDENLWNSHWCLIRSHHNYPLRIYFLHSYHQPCL